MEQLEFKKRRKKVSELLKDGEMALFFSGKVQRKTADEMYPFFANRNFYYFTGVGQENTTLMVAKNNAVEESLYSLVSVEEEEIWTGRRLREDELENISGISRVRPAESFVQDLHGLLAGGRYHTVWLCLDTLRPDQAEDLEHYWARYIREVYPDIQIRSSYHFVSRLRKFKSHAEVQAIRTGMEITNAGIRRMMGKCQPGMMEYQLEGEFLYELSQRGQRMPAFPSIVASGERNFYLHYPNPMQQIEDNALVLVDVGAPFDGYCTDISRVFPANGVFSKKQKEIYQIAFEANREIIDRIRPGQTFSVPNEICRKVAFRGLKNLGLIQDLGDIRKYVWHGTTHHVGLDTHDVGGYEEDMAAGMVFTVDAGIYVREWGIGLRIEDNVLVTEDGCENLSAMILAEITEIEEFMGR